jgi:hypothetical protein
MLSPSNISIKPPSSPFFISYASHRRHIHWFSSLFYLLYVLLCFVCCAVKKFSEWPTIPQLYVNGEFIGGCDIVTQMHESGELKDLLATVNGNDK